MEIHDDAKEEKDKCDGFNYQSSKDITFGRLFAMLNYPKKFEIFYDIDILNFKSSGDESVTSTPAALQSAFLAKLIDMCKAQVSEQQKPQKAVPVVRSSLNLSNRRPILPYNANALKPGFETQLQPLKNQFVKKMLFDGKKIEVNASSQVVSHACKMSLQSKNLLRSRIDMLPQIAQRTATNENQTQESAPVPSAEGANNEPAVDLNPSELSVSSLSGFASLLAQLEQSKRNDPGGGANGEINGNNNGHTPANGAQAAPNDTSMCSNSFLNNILSKELVDHEPGLLNGDNYNNANCNFTSITPYPNGQASMEGFDSKDFRELINSCQPKDSEGQRNEGENELGLVNLSMLASENSFD